MSESQELIINDIITQRKKHFSNEIAKLTSFCLEEAKKGEFGVLLTPQLLASLWNCQIHELFECDTTTVATTTTAGGDKSSWIGKWFRSNRRDKNELNKIQVKVDSNGLALLPQDYDSWVYMVIFDLASFQLYNHSCTSSSSSLLSFNGQCPFIFFKDQNNDEHKQISDVFYDYHKEHFIREIQNNARDYFASNPKEVEWKVEKSLFVNEVVRFRDHNYETDAKISVFLDHLPIKKFTRRYHFPDYFVFSPFQLSSFHKSNDLFLFK